LGVAAGALGQALDRQWLQSLTRPAALLATATLLGAAAWRLLGWNAPRSVTPGTTRSPYARALKRAFALPPLARAGALGLASTLLPCGWLWSFVILAAGTGSAWSGGVVMASFWVGTLPALAGVGAIARLLGKRLVPRVTSLVLVVLALVSFGLHTRLLGRATAATPRETAAFVAPAPTERTSIPPAHGAGHCHE
jgi:sulfite exporter TauE/SafE